MFVDVNTDIDGIVPGDTVQIVRGWSLDSLFPAETPDGTQVWFFEPRPRGVNISASSIYEYTTSGGFWYNVVTGKAAGEVVFHETDVLLVRDPRAEGAPGGAYLIEIAGKVSPLTPRVDLGVRPESAPQEVRFGVPRTVSLEASGLGASGDRLYVLPASGGTTPTAMYVFFEGFGWFEGAINVNSRELEPGRAYVYRRAAPEPRDVVSTFSLLLQQSNFLDNQGNPVSEGAAFGILVDTTGNGFDPTEFRPFPSLVPGDRPVFLLRSDGTSTGVALVYAGAFSGHGYIGGTPGIRHATGGGVAETGDRWGLIWFPEVPAGATPKAWQGFGFYTNDDMRIPEPGRTVSVRDIIPKGPKSADWYPLTPITFESFEAWTTAHFYSFERADPERTSPAGDPEDSGVPNLLRYAFDLDPRRPVFVGGLPKVTVSVPPGGTERYQMITYRRFIDANDVRYLVQVSEDFLTWTDLTEEHEVSVESGFGERHERVTVRDSEPVESSGGRFMRVQVSRD